jgi:hypothetical protein
MRQIALLRDRLLLLMLFGAIGAMILSNLSSNEQVPNLTSFFDNVAAIVQAKMALAQGQFPLRAAVYGFSDWHYPLFQFNSPTSYTLAGLIYRFICPNNPFIAFKLTIWCALLCGGIYMYRLVCWMCQSKPAAVLASIMYLTSPYYIIVINHLGDFNEAIALGILPAVVFYTLQRYFHPSENKTLLQTSLAWYLLATVHVITFFYTSAFVGLFILLLTVKNPKSSLNLVDTLIAYLFGCLLALWYLGPVFMLQNYLNIDSMATNGEIFSAYRPYLAHLLSPVQNILAGVKVAGTEITGVPLLHPNLGFPLLFAVIVGVYSFFSPAKNDNTHPMKAWLSPLLLIFGIAFLMVWTPINIWQWLPHSFMIGLYSWRLLGQVIWIGALLFGLSVCWFFEDKLSVRHVVIGAFLIIAATSVWLIVPERSLVDLKISKLVKDPHEVSGENYLLNVQKNIMSINAIDSVSAKGSRGSSLYLNAEKTLAVDKTQPDCHLEQSTTVCHLKVPASINLIELPVLYYPDMLSIDVNGKSVSYSSVLYKNYIIAAITPQPGLNDITIDFRGLPWANSLSNMAWWLWLLFFAFVFLIYLSQKEMREFDQ